MRVKVEGPSRTFKCLLNKKKETDKSGITSFLLQVPLQVQLTPLYRNQSTTVSQSIIRCVMFEVEVQPLLTIPGLDLEPDNDLYKNKTCCGTGCKATRRGPQQHGTGCKATRHKTLITLNKH